MQKKPLPTKIFLIGPMGAGKSTIGRQLAKNINYNFYDTDKMITEHAGVDIPTIFDYEGEGGFRKREAEVIQKLTSKYSNMILATGGGTILNSDTREILKEVGFVIYLQTTVAEQLVRIGNDKNRPLIQTDNPKAKMIELMEERAPIYEAMADLIFNTNKYKINNIHQELVKQITTR